MKNIFSFTVTKGESTEVELEQLKSYTLRELESDLGERRKKVSQEFYALMDNLRMPAWLTIAKYIGLAVGILLIFSCLRVVLERGMDAITNGYVILIFVCGVVLVAFGAICFFVEGIKKRRIEQSDEYKELKGKYEEYGRSNEEMLNIPESKEAIDIFYQVYEKNENGETVLCEENQYLNQQNYIFLENNMICIANQEAVFGFDINWIKELAQSPNQVTFMPWNKEEDYTSSEYKEYDICDSQDDFLHIKNAYHVILENDNESFYFVIPPYEYDKFMSYIKEANRSK